MSNPLSNLSVEALRRAVAIRQQIAALEAELNSLASAPSGRSLERRMSAWDRVRMAAKEHASQNGHKGGTALARPVKNEMSSAARARISASQKARWARVKAAAK